MIGQGNSALRMIANKLAVQCGLHGNQRTGQGRDMPTSMDGIDKQVASVLGIATCLVLGARTFRLGVSINQTINEETRIHRR